MEDTWPTLKNPPITEALLEVRFSLSDKVGLKQLEAFAQAEESAYPGKQPLYEQSVHAVFGKEDHSARSFVHPIGFRLQNSQGNRICQVRVDRISVSFLPPYDSWPALREATKEQYGRYRAMVPQDRIVRVGMRYINSFKLPDRDDIDLEQFLNTMPRLPKHVQLSEAVSGFETVIVMPLLDVGCTAIVRQKLVRSEDKKVLGPSLVLDIDVYHNALEGLEESDMWKKFDQMRNKRNAIFYGSVTEQALEPYK